jgi:hypothetical protein
MGCASYIRCPLSTHQKECRKSLGCALSNIQKFYMVLTVRLCFIWITQQTATFALVLFNRGGECLLCSTDLVLTCNSDAKSLKD